MISLLLNSCSLSGKTHWQVTMRVAPRQLPGGKLLHTHFDLKRAK
jgi:hypothetical protein